ncbi:hypothetical protein JZO72_02740 [Vagococcus fluvialis]|uniref:hypothetical protein n=1 Tax=Vagococcus fluvialis TaxID=2738 RepID=UPI001A8F1DD4|nr:hypothetical protein [Vagococcus fluvialis]MBO0478535.1 hypothetical protein [Vagococcus fluvialis]
MKKLDKHEQKIPLEVGVFLLLALCMGQNILLNGAVSPEGLRQELCVNGKNHSVG